jgi:hypothetical protein
MEKEQGEKKMVSLPVDKLSYSGLTQLLRNPLIFKLKQILGVYDSKVGISAMIGRAGHEALKFYYGGMTDRPVPADPVERRTDAIAIGMEYLTKTDDFYIKYGKTGTREQMLAGYTQAMNFYFAEEPDYNEIVCCEEKLDAEIKNHDGQVFPLPAVGVPDLIEKCKDGTHDIIDAKFVKSFTRYENEDGEPYEDYIKIIQAKFLDYLVIATKQIHAKRVIFREIKRTKNKDESSQIRDYIIPLDHKPYDIIFINLYADVVKFISNPNSIYLPNLSDPFDGEQAGLLYAEGLLNADMSDVEVMHKVKDVALVSKKFVSSRLDQAQNAHLLPEEKIKLRLAEFGIPVQPVETKVGASVTQYRFKVSAGISMGRFKKHKDDIARAIEAKGELRILAPIPGTSLVGIEVANAERKAVYMEKEHLVANTLSLPIGMTVQGEVIRELLNEMPHLLVAGSTGSGKSILLHGIITALTKQMKPKDMHLVLIDPKRVELVAFAEAKHLQGKKVLYEYEDVVRKLMQLADEMESRYKILEKAKLRDIGEYNATINKKGFIAHRRLPYIVVVVDEFADLILRSKVEEKKKSVNYSTKSKRWLHNDLVKRGGKSGKYTLKSEDNTGELKSYTIRPSKDYDKDHLIDILEALDNMDDINRGDASVEYLTVRLAQMGRAVGIHLIIATQRPSVDVITGLIKANFPTRIALTTASHVDSEVIIGKPGAEKLTGKGDMIFVHPSRQGDVRLQGFLIK